MPADPTIPTKTSHHNSGSAPYPCSAWERPPSAPWSIAYGYCRHSLDVLYGATDPRCPATCPHKAPQTTSEHFDKLFHWRGANAAAEWARQQKNAR